ncbi:protein serine/threonine kinase protein [Trichomonas vaginalis G3]|uniref:protein serine/threonine kinase protein n=1 Tax=Trichomonas vaginalis (strain ATCC PRA-98 / G3) TaxID=412133 RepID=UPI0021E537B8|nr:protein serine/threonine kinase protein [Trichomonas vaginalis G3]KAI5507465.1 protein serine/threonine kinase protein [Trichomonas vaginalis G3]
MEYGSIDFVDLFSTRTPNECCSPGCYDECFNQLMLIKSGTLDLMIFASVIQNLTQSDQQNIAQNLFKIHSDKNGDNSIYKEEFQSLLSAKSVQNFNTVSQFIETIYSLWNLKQP